MSQRKSKPFIKINCAAIPSNLLEAELFGYEKGAFTGANSRKIGLFEMANHGTILLDELGDFPLELQPKLLRVLQQGELYRIGCSTPVKLDVRVIAATNANLKARMLDGTFREDLYYRLSVFPVRVPPLRERREDILTLARRFLEMYNKKYNRTVTLPKEIGQALELYDWPGNVREMQNIMEYYVICSDEGNEMSFDQLTRVFQIGKKAESGVKAPHEEVDASLRGGHMPIDASQAPLFELRDNYEKFLIMDALRRTNSVRQAAIIKLRRRTGKTVNIRLHLTQKPFGGQGTLPVQRRQHPLGSIQRIGRVRRLCHAVGIYEKRIAGADLQLIFPVPGVLHSRQDKAVGIPEQFKLSP